MGSTSSTHPNARCSSEEAARGRSSIVRPLQALAPEKSQLSQRLFSLVRKELVQPERTMLAGDDAFRLRDFLIRDAAYNTDMISAQGDARLISRRSSSV